MKVEPNYIITLKLERGSIKERLELRKMDPVTGNIYEAENAPT